MVTAPAMKVKIWPEAAAAATETVQMMVSCVLTSVACVSAQVQTELVVVSVFVLDSSTLDN